MADLKPCGTTAAYVRHLRHGEEPCADCRRASAEQSNGRVAARSRALTRLAHLHPGEFAALYEEEKD